MVKPFNGRTIMTIMLYSVLFFNFDLWIYFQPINSPVISWLVVRRDAVGYDGWDVLEQNRSHFYGQGAGVRWGTGGGWE